MEIFQDTSFPSLFIYFFTCDDISTCMDIKKKKKKKKSNVIGVVINVVSCI